jgi:hypothetical protein
MQNKRGFRIQVFVYDYAGVPIAKAKVSVQPKSGKSRSTKTLPFDKKIGGYIVAGVKPGKYVLRAGLTGYETDEREVMVGHADVRQVFVLGRKGMSFLYRGTVKVPFELHPDLLGLALKPGAAEKEKRELTEFAESLKLKVEVIADRIHKENVRVFSFPKGMSEDNKAKIQERIATHRIVQYAGPVVRIDKEAVSFLTDTIIVKFKSSAVKEEIFSFAKQFRFSVVRHIPYAGNTFELRFEGLASMEILTICAEMVKTGKVEYAEPDLFSTVVEDQIIPSDYLFPEQWHHNLIRTPDAWQLLTNLNPNDTFGSPNIIISVVDSGVDVANRDFAGNVSSGTSKVYQLFDFANMVANNNNLASDHGTGCAGAAIGNTNNPSPVAGQNEGIAGVAGNCRLIGIRRSGPESRYSDAYIWMAGFDPNSTIAGFPAQISPGADVITNSFGYSTGLPISGLMADTFDYLTTYGRGGKGVLLFFSVGNNPVDFTLQRPWAAYEKTFAISASTLANDGVTEVFTNYSGFGGAGIVDLCVPSQDEYLGARPLHNPPQNYGAVTCDIVGNGNLPGHPAVQTTLTQAVNAAPFTTLTANVAMGGTTLNVGSTAGFAVNQWIRIGQHGDGNAEWVQITAVPGGNQLTVTACVNGHDNGGPIFGSRTLSVANNTGFAVGQWLLLGQIGQVNTEVCLIREIPAGTTQIVVAGPLHNHANNTVVVTGPSDYRNSFGGTSFSTPVAAGVGALLLSANPELSWTRARDILRTTATRIDAANINPIGQYVDNDGDGIAEYSRWYGFGRIDTEAAVQAAINLIGITPTADIDTWIKENTIDVGDVPCPPPYSPDVWVRNVDPAVDNPAQVTIHQEPIRGQDNWVYVNVRNRGTVDSNDVYLRIFITRWAGTQYVYPDDFIPTNPPGSTPTQPLEPGTYLIDELHIDSILAGGMVTVNTVWPANLIPPASVTIGGVTYSWADACLLVDVSPHDGPTPTGNHTWDNNNLCQKNVFPVDPADSDDLSIAFVVGHRLNAADIINLRIVRRGLPKNVKLYFDYIDQDKAKRVQALLDQKPGAQLTLKTCDVTFLSKVDVELNCAENQKPTAVVIGPKTKLTLVCCHPMEMKAKYQLYPSDKERPTVFALPVAQTVFVPIPREKNRYQVMAIRLKGLKTLKKGQYCIDIYQEAIDGRLEGGINLIINKRKK